MTKTPLLFILLASMLNGERVIDNSKIFGGNPLQSPRDAVEIATSIDSREYFTLEQKISAPIMTITAADVSSRGHGPPWDITSSQLILLQK